MDAAAELGRNVVSTHQIQPEYGDEQADAGRDCRTRLARPNFSGTNADRNIFIFSVQLTTCRTGNLTQLIHTLAICVTHTYIHTYMPFSTIQYPKVYHTRCGDADAPLSAPSPSSVHMCTGTGTCTYIYSCWGWSPFFLATPLTCLFCFVLHFPYIFLILCEYLRGTVAQGSIFYVVFILP